MAGATSRGMLPTISQLREQGYSNTLQSRFGDGTYLFAVKDSVQVDLASMSPHELVRWSLENNASVRVFKTNPRGRITRELDRRDISELPLPEEAAEVGAQQAAAEAPAVERLRLGKDTNPRTRQVIRALESLNYEGITFPATGGARAEFFQQFSDPERAFLQRAWDFASQKERELFAAELNAFFAEAGDGRMGMMTLAKILQKMASDYLSHQGPYAQARFFTVADFYYYAGTIMADEKTVGGGREHSIGSLGRAMRGTVERRYNRLVDELKEERRSAIIRRLPGLEQVPTPAEAAQLEAAPEEAPSESAPAEAAPVQLPSALDRMYMHYSQIEFDQYLISRLPANSPHLPAFMASMRAHEDEFLQFVQTLPPEVQEAARWRVQAINDRRAAELSAPVAAAPVATAPVEAAPAEAAQAAPVEAYDYAGIHQIAERIGVLVPVEYDLGDPRIFDTGLFPDTGEEVHGLYRELYAHFADLDALIAGGTLTAEQAKFLRDTKTKVSAALQAAGE
ncbi:MAG: hypothetical protein PHQ80_02060 [Candidatus ainarchaeum sp.]|nr:hypothetical protein [Candidatus ainarchaeum sp.]